MTKRLIEEWLPIADLSEESIRERRSMTALPPIYYLHVWWARRPLVASRAAVLASLLPADADRKTFRHVLGIHGDPVKAQKLMDQARRTGERVKDPYGYERAFKYKPSEADHQWITESLKSLGIENPSVLDPTAGGGSIPFEALRLGCDVFANDLNPVAVLVQKATYEWPKLYGSSLLSEYNRIAKILRSRLEERLNDYFPQPGAPDRIDATYLWARTITCPYCDGLIPLSPNWKLAPDGTGVKLLPQLGDGVGTPGRICKFEIVKKASEQSPGIVSRGNATCPYPDCGRVVTIDEIKSQAQQGLLGEQLFTVVYKEKVKSTSPKTGKVREKWERRYRVSQDSDELAEFINDQLSKKIPEWEALDCWPTEAVEPGFETSDAYLYGINSWTDYFSPRQLLCHGTSVEVFRELLAEEEQKGELSEVKRAAFGYLALSLDKLRDYNSRMTRWHSNRQVVVNTFDRHDFAFKWSYTEMAPLIVGLGYDWALQQTAKCLKELLELTINQSQLTQNLPLFGDVKNTSETNQAIHISNESGDSLYHIEDASLDAVVLDPPYYDNVMYAELSDFFYVWLKRTAGYVYPELFTRHLTDKDQEAVANPAKFKGQKGAKALAGED